MQDVPMTGAAGTYAESGYPLEASTSGVAWPAIIGGAVAAAALSLILLALGSGFGLASVSPWSATSATTFTAMTAVWLIVIQWLASGVGGYLTGRLRTKWVGLHTHEVFFRDTANGFLSWALASVIGAAFLASAASSVLGGTATTVADPMGYFVDSLYRTDHPSTSVADADVRAQSSRILLQAEVPAADKSYLAQLVSARTGLAPVEATRRVDEVVARVNVAEAKARKAGAYLSIFMALSMLVGAFIACVAAALGGQQRDEY